MISVGSLQLVHFVEQQLESWTFDRAHWPLHVTIVPWFIVEDEEAAIRSLQRVADNTNPMVVAVGEQDNLGDNGAVPVNLIRNDGLIHELHESLYETLIHADTAFHEKNYMGDSFLPHITRHVVDGRNSNEGEEIQINDFHLVRLVDAKTCLVEKQFNLKRV